jgi:hypothetical protein
VLLNTRLDLASLSAPTKPGAPRVARTTDGRRVAAALVLLCTGQSPNSCLMRELLPESVVEEGEGRGLIRVLRSMQVAVPAEPQDIESEESAPTPPASRSPSPAPAPPLEDAAPAPDSAAAQAEPDAPADDDAHLRAPHPHLFAIGDAADAWGAIKAGHTAYWQAGVAARNIVRLARADAAAAALAALPPSASAAERAECERAVEEARGEPLERYAPGARAIKVSLGLGAAAWEVGGEVGAQAEGGPDDLDAKAMWSFWGQPDVGEEGMHA